MHAANSHWAITKKKKHNHQVTKTCDQIFIEWQHKKHHSYQWGSLPNSSPMSYFRASSSPIGHCWGFLRRWVSVDMAPRPVGLSRRCFEERLLHLGKLKLEDVPNRKENFYHQLNHVNHVDNFGNLKIRFHDQNWWFFFHIDKYFKSDLFFRWVFWHEFIFCIHEETSSSACPS